MKQPTNMKPSFLKTILSMMAAALCLLVGSTAAEAQTQYTSDDINNAILLPGSIRPTWTQPEDAPWQIDGDKVYSYSYYTYLDFTYTSDKPTVIIYYDGGDRYIYENGHDYSNRIFYGNRAHNMLKLEAGEHNLSFGPDGSNDSRYAISSFGIFELDENIDSSKVLTQKSKGITFENDSVNPWYVSGDGILRTSRVASGFASSKIKLKFTVDKISKLSWLMRNWDYNDCEFNGNELDIYDGAVWFDAKSNDSWTKCTEVFLPGTHEITFEDNQWNTSSSYNSTGCRVLTLRNIELNDEWFEVNVTAGDLGNSVIDEISKSNYSYLTDVELLKIKGKLNSNDWNQISQMTNLMALDISETDVTEIPASQFSGNTMLTYINLPSGLKTINSKAFSGSNLKYLTLPDQVTTINESAFQSNRIQSVSIPASVEYIGKNAFSDTWMKTLTFADDAKLSKLGFAAFSSNKYLTEVELPESLLDFETESYHFYQSGEWLNSGGYNSSYYYNFYSSHAFANSGIKSIKFPSALKSIPACFCYGCDSLKNVILPTDLEEILAGAFHSSGVTEVKLPENLQYIGRYAFWKSSQPENQYIVRFPESLKEIWRGAFYNGNLSEVKLPLNLTSIETEAFYGNANMKSITLHSGAKNLPKFLDGCDALETIILPCATPPTRTEDILGNQDKKKINLIVPNFSVSNYRLDDYWYLFGSINAGDEASNQPYWNVTGDLVLREGYRMDGAPTVEIANNASIMVNGDTPATFGDLIFNFNENSPASFVNNCPSATAGSINVRYAVSANRWYMFTPMFDVDLADISVTGTSNYVFRYYDAEARAAGTVNTTGASSNWKNVTESSLKAGQGYIFQCDADCEIIFPESSVSGSRVLATTQSDIALKSIDSETTANKSWNLIGNPYPSYFDVWYLDVEAPITVYWKESNGNVRYSAISLSDDDYVLKPMQAFFIQRPDDASDALFEIDGRQPTNVIGSHQGQKAKRVRREDAKRTLFNIEILDSEGESLDRTRVVINDNAKLDYEIKCDAAKFLSKENGAVQLYTVDPEGNYLAINERPLADGKAILGIKTGDERQYTIRATRADGDVWLTDLQSGASYDLTEEDFILYCDANAIIDGRYELSFAPGTNGVAAAMLQPKAEGGVGCISIENPKEETVSVYTTDGRMILSASESSMQCDATAGVYVVRIGEKNFKLIVK